MPPFIIAQNKFEWNHYSDQGRILYETYYSPMCIFIRKTWNWIKPTILKITCLLSSDRLKHVDSFENTAVLYIGYFPRMKKISPLPSRRNSHYPQCILFWSAGKYFLISFVWKWTTWTGIRKQDNFVGEFPSGNVRFVIVFLVTTWQSFDNKSTGSLDCVQHFVKNIYIPWFAIRPIFSEIWSVWIWFKFVWTMVYKASVIICDRIREENIRRKF